MFNLGWGEMKWYPHSWFQLVWQCVIIQPRMLPAETSRKCPRSCSMVLDHHVRESARQGKNGEWNLASCSTYCFFFKFLFRQERGLVTVIFVNQLKFKSRQTLAQDVLEHPLHTSNINGLKLPWSKQCLVCCQTRSCGRVYINAG